MGGERGLWLSKCSLQSQRGPLEEPRKDTKMSARRWLFGQVKAEQRSRLGLGPDGKGTGMSDKAFLPQDVPEAFQADLVSSHFGFMVLLRCCIFFFNRLKLVATLVEQVYCRPFSTAFAHFVSLITC